VASGNRSLSRQINCEDLTVNRVARVIPVVPVIPRMPNLIVLRWAKTLPVKLAA
jgi:hypothetical protein